MDQLSEQTESLTDDAQGISGSDWEKRAVAVQTLIQQVLSALQTEQAKPSIGDLIRLIQMEGEFQGHMPKDVTVRWIKLGEE